MLVVFQFLITSIGKIINFWFFLYQKFNFEQKFKFLSNNLSAMQHQQQQQLGSQASSVTHLLHGANPIAAMNQTAQHQIPQESPQQVLAADLLQQMQMVRIWTATDGQKEKTLPWFREGVLKRKVAKMRFLPKNDPFWGKNVQEFYKCQKKLHL
jgi:hypothetical protein